MSSKEIIEKIKVLATQPTPPRQIAIIASDRILRERTLNSFAEELKLQAEGKWKYDIKRIKLSQAKDQDLKTFIFESNAQSFFSKKQIFLIEELEKVSGPQTDILLSLFKQRQTENYYFFLGTGLLSTSRLMKQFKEQNSVITLPNLKLPEFKNWIKGEFNSKNLLPEPRVIDHLAQSCELLTDIALAKIEQLELFADTQKITLSMAEDLFPSELALKKFAWLDAISSGNKLLAQKLVSQALSEGKEALGLTALIQGNYLNYYLIISLRNQGYSQQQIKASLKIEPWLFDLQYSTASQKDLKRLIKDLKVLVLADSKLKNKSLGSEAVLHELINSLS